jgi:hypothetical protein
METLAESCLGRRLVERSLCEDIYILALKARKTYLTLDVESSLGPQPSSNYLNVAGVLCTHGLYSNLPKHLCHINPICTSLLV